MHSKLIRHLLITFVLLFQGSTVFAAYTPGQTPPAPTALQQELNSTSYAGGFRWTPVTLPWLTNGSQTAFGGSLDTSSRLSVNPQGTAENGLTVNMPSGATGYGLTIKNSTGDKNIFTGDATAYGLSRAASAPSMTFGFNNGFGLSTMSIGINPTGGAPYIYTNAGLAFNNYLAPGGYQSYPEFVPFTVLKNKYASNNPSVLADFMQFSYKDTSNIVGTPVFSVKGGGGVVSKGYISVLPISAPVITITSPSNGTGQTYYYVVTGVSGGKESLISNEASIVNNATLSATYFNYVNPSNVVVAGSSAGRSAGYEAFNIYRGTSPGGETFLKTLDGANFYYADNGTDTPTAQVPPTANTSGYVAAPFVNATTAFQANGTKGITTTLADGSAVTGGIVTTAPTLAGTDTQTLRYNGTALTATSSILNNGAQIALGGSVSTATRLSVNPLAIAENGLTVNMPLFSTGNPLTLNYFSGNLASIDTNGSLYLKGYTGIGTAATSTSRLSVNPQSAAENGLTVTMPSGATGNALTVKSSTGTTLASIGVTGIMTVAGYACNVRAVTATDTATQSDTILLCNGTFTETINSLAVGQAFTIKNMGTGVITISFSGGYAPLDGHSSAGFTLPTQYQSRTFINSGTSAGYIIISGYL